MPTRSASLRWLRANWSSSILVPLGLGLVVAAMLQRKGHEFASVTLVTGGVLVLVGALHHKIVRAEFAGGKLELRPEAGAVTARIARQPHPPPAEAVGPHEEDDATRWVLATRLFDDLLLKPTGALEGCTVQLYLFDEEQELLLPILDPGHPGPSPGFAPGQGVTGVAWETGEYVTAEGPAVADETFGLSPEQKERYGDLVAVTAMPVTNAAGTVIAVLSAAALDVGSGLLTEEGFEQHAFLAEAAARIMIDLLKWFTDDHDDG